MLIGSLSSLSSRLSSPSAQVETQSRDTTKQTHRAQETRVESCKSAFTHAAHARRVKLFSTTTPTTSLWDSPWPATGPGDRTPASRRLLPVRLFIYNRTPFRKNRHLVATKCQRLFQWRKKKRCCWLHRAWGANNGAPSLGSLIFQNALPLSPCGVPHRVSSSSSTISCISYGEVPCRKMS